MDLIGRDLRTRQRTAGYEHHKTERTRNIGLHVAQSRPQGLGVALKAVVQTCPVRPLDLPKVVFLQCRRAQSAPDRRTGNVLQSGWQRVPQRQVAGGLAPVGVAQGIDRVSAARIGLQQRGRPLQRTGRRSAGRPHGSRWRPVASRRRNGRSTDGQRHRKGCPRRERDGVCPQPIFGRIGFVNNGRLISRLGYDSCLHAIAGVHWLNCRRRVGHQEIEPGTVTGNILNKTRRDTRYGFRGTQWDPAGRDARAVGVRIDRNPGEIQGLFIFTDCHLEAVGAVACVDQGVRQIDSAAHRNAAEVVIRQIKGTNLAHRRLYRVGHYPARQAVRIPVACSGLVADDRVGWRRCRQCDRRKQPAAKATEQQARRQTAQRQAQQE